MARVTAARRNFPNAPGTIVAVGPAVHGKEPKTRIETDATTLLAIGEVMALMLEDLHACGGTQCMGRAIDGIKLWVTQNQFDAAHKRAACMQNVLRCIAADGVRTRPMTC